MNQLIFGCGYLGRRVGRRWVEAGRQVTALTRSAERGRQLRAAGIRPLIGDLMQPERMPALPPADTVLFAVGYDRAAGYALGELYVEGLRAVLERLPSPVERFIYISSTGVYGQTDGRWVDEQSPCEPTRAGGRACLEAERLLAAHPMGSRRIVLRLAGIYGPGRIPRQHAIAAGGPVPCPEHGHLNLIHVDDAVRVVLAAERLEPPELLVVADGHPVARRDYYRELARQLGAPSPQFVAPSADAPAARRAGSDKRIDNRRLRERLGLSLHYPSYREGLAAILAAER